IGRAAMRIKWMLEKARHQHSFPPLWLAERVLRAVAVVYVEVDDRHPLEALDLERLGGGPAAVVENAKAHRARRRRMMTAGPHGTKRVLRAAGHHFVDRQQPGARRAL